MGCGSNPCAISIPRWPPMWGKMSRSAMTHGIWPKSVCTIRSAFSVGDTTFQWLIRQFEERMIVLSDTGFHAAEGDPANLKFNWLQVFRRANAARLGSERKLQHQTRVVR